MLRRTAKIDLARTANLLGALATGVSDAVCSSTKRQTARSGETPAALVALGHVPGLSNDAFSKALRLSHAGCVRLVDRLEADGLVERRPRARDARSVALYLTRAGIERRRRVLADRQTAIADFIGRLTRSEQMNLQRLLEKILVHLPQDDLHALAICRLCDERVCPHCSVELARLRKRQPVAAAAPSG